MAEHRNHFTFWESFFDAISDLPEPEQLPLYEAICRYGLYGEEPETELPGFARTLFKTIRPNLDSGRKNAKSGSVGGSTERNGSALGSKNEARLNQIASGLKSNWKQLEIEKKEKGNRKDDTSVCAFESEFAELWKAYPRKQGKAAALKAYQNARKGGATFEEIRDGLERYKAHIAESHLEERYVKQGSTWFNQRSWEDEYAVPEEGTPICYAEPDYRLAGFGGADG